ncbi:PP2C family protein-serine/threonine phosphatase [Dyadobacter pollutisoli]|uniref:Protein phosphatase 2C domain-containing protein n=1 Tax=Dyadobacter pollutisoli TaxID=2910158 RepID=A0A9E8N5E1_9BACT|nr:protein phosphatase 2C domain-containing protein [Dyadobacter pollutisoli]WAC10144.1 protein phosphatase 2C domain-containing protein [Dyadobacter pollutisoli]
MKIQTGPPLAIHGLGKRANNEDNLYPALGSATSKDTLFMVCDGVGGSEKGEIASDIACKAIADYYQKNRIAVSDTLTVENAVAFARAEMERYCTDNPDSRGMATTLTFLHLHEHGATIAHVGDSRVYHVRDGQIVWCTKDHSYVNDLVKAGVITEAEARTHPRRNVIMRALQAEDKDVKADVHHIKEPESGDYFFLCSDGVLESLDDDELASMFSANISDEARMEHIRKRCETFSQDNFTAYLVPIRTVEMLTVELLPAEEIAANVKTVKADPAAKEKTSNINLWLLVALIIISTGVFLLRKRTPELKPAKPTTEQVKAQKDTLIPLHAAVPTKQRLKAKKNKKAQ